MIAEAEKLRFFVATDKNEAGEDIWTEVAMQQIQPGDKVKLREVTGKTRIGYAAGFPSLEVEWKTEGWNIW